VNEVISRDLEVIEEFYSKVEAEKIFNLSRLPDNAGEGIRVIKIGDYDCCPCSGSHVSRTKEIGNFKIGSTDYSEGVLRIRFKLIEK
jgi:Ser-tRNA(Ala) deacylase AlaX